MRRVHSLFGYPFISHRTSDVGLTGTTKSPGVLCRAPMVLIDEFDKIDKDDQDGTLEAMSDGEVTITVGGEYVVYPAQVRIIAACNNGNMRPEQEDRFDLIYTLEHPDKDQLKTIMDMKLKKLEGGTGGKEHRLWVVKYIQWCCERIPKIENKTKIQGILNKHIDELSDKGDSCRKVDRIIKIAVAIARIKYGDITEPIIKEAIGMVSSVLK